MEVFIKAIMFKRIFIDVIISFTGQECCQFFQANH